MFKQKYLKYKLKYLSLKEKFNKINQQGYGITASTAEDSDTISQTELNKKIIIYDYDTKAQLYEINKYDEDKTPHTLTSLTYFILNELKKNPENDTIEITHINLYKTIISGTKTYCDKGINGKINNDLPNTTSDMYCLQIKKPISVHDQIPKSIKTGHIITLSNGDSFDFNVVGNVIRGENGFTGNGKMTYNLIINNIIYNISYEGDIINNYENGNGLKISIKSDTKDKLIEEGTFTNGKLKRGKIIFNDGIIAETVTKINPDTKKATSGWFNNLDLFGFGKLSYPNGETHEGIFAKQILYGTIKFPTGQIIETKNGYFKNFYLNNYGKITYPDGTICEGKFKDAVLHGKGKIYEPDGYFEEGIFKDGILFKGKKNVPNRYIAEGKFKINGLNGKGKICFAYDKSCEEGIFKDGKLHGQGKISQPNKYIVEGNFNMGKLNGIGKIINLQSGIKKEGMFQNGLLHGKGEMTVDFITYKGNFYKGELDGVIEVIDYIGKKKIETYKRGILIQESNKLPNDTNIQTNIQTESKLVTPPLSLIITPNTTPIKSIQNTSILPTTPSKKKISQQNVFSTPTKENKLDKQNSQETSQTPQTPQTPQTFNK